MPDWQGTVRSVCLQWWMVAGSGEHPAARSLATKAPVPWQFLSVGHACLSCPLAPMVSPGHLPPCVQRLTQRSPWVNRLSSVLHGSSVPLKLALGSDPVLWITFPFPLWRPLLALIWLFLWPLKGWPLSIQPVFRIKGRMVLCFQIPAMLLLLWLFISPSLFHLIYSYSQPLSTSPQNHLRDGWEAHRGTALEHPGLFLSSHT